MNTELEPTMSEPTMPEPTAERRGRPNRWVPAVLLLVAVSALAATVWAVWLREDEQEDLGKLYEVVRGALVIDVSSDGQIQNRELKKVRSEVQGRNRIIELEVEGAQVKKGDVLVRLDSSSLEDRKEEYQLAVDRAEASHVAARTKLENTQSQAASDVERADLDFALATLDLEKYLEGDYAQELMKAKNDITIADEQLKRADDKLAWSKRLKEKNFISEDEFKGDELSRMEKQLSLDLATEKLKLLEKYTRRRKVRELESKVKQTKAALERAQRKAEADVVEAKAELKSRESELKRQKERLDKLNEQIAKCTITAPVDGMVVYATTSGRRWWSQQDPLSEGTEVQQRQELIHLPVSTKMMAEVKIQESSLRKLKKGQRARITVDVAKGKVFWGRVGKIALMPDQQSPWQSSDVKVYTVQVHLDGAVAELRAGMSCRVEIIIATYEDAVYVPIQSVVRFEGTPCVFVARGDEAERREVKIGLDNGVHVHILSGLEGGEKVLVAPPLSESTVGITSGVIPDAPKDDGKNGEEDDDEKKPAVPFDPAKWQKMSREEKRKAMESMTSEQKQQLFKQMGGTRRRRPRSGDNGGGDRNRRPRTP